MCAMGRRPVPSSTRGSRARLAAGHVFTLAFSINVSVQSRPMIDIADVTAVNPVQLDAQSAR
jgi:hypothetical protein